jgi:uncharacterized phage-associated protein
MLVEHHREKLVNAVLFFAQNTHKCGKTKLFKLLNFLDFEHYKLVGRSVTGLDYFAWKMGPVPPELFEEMDSPKEDMRAAVSFEKRVVQKGEMTAVVAKAEFDEASFSKRELKIMRNLADEYKNASADEMVEEAHLETKPWHQVWEEEGRKQGAIPYEYALVDKEHDPVQELVRENDEIRSNFK